MSRVVIEVHAQGQPSCRYELDQPEVLVGRSMAAHVRLAGEQVSRQHCKLVDVGGRWRLWDCQSANGVFLDRGGRGAPFLARNDPLLSGDQLYIGRYRLTVVLDPPAATAGPAGAPGGQGAEAAMAMGNFLDEQTVRESPVRTQDQMRQVSRSTAVAGPANRFPRTA